MTDGASSEWTFGRVLALMDEQGRTGVLAVGGEHDQTRLHIRKGYVVYVDRPRGAEKWLLGEYLVSTRSAKLTDLLAALKESERTGGMVEDIIVERKLVSEDVLRRFSDLQVAELLFPLFPRTGLAIRFLEERPHSPEFVTPLPVSYILKEAERRAELWPAVRQRVGRPTAVYRKDGSVLPELLGYVQPDNDSDEPLPEISADARIVYFFVNGAKTVEQVARAAGLGLFETYRASAELLDAYLLTLVTTHGEGERTGAGESVLPRLVSIITYAVIAALLLLGAQWVIGRSSELRSSLTASSPAIDRVVERSRFHQIEGALQLHELQVGAYPEALADLVTGGYLGRDAAQAIGRLDYQVTETGYALGAK